MKSRSEEARRTRRTMAIRRARVTALRLVAGLGALGFVVVMALLSIWPPINDVTTGETAEYPDVQPRAYRFSQDRVTAAAAESIEALERFALVSVDEEAGVVVATADTRSGRWTDDITVRVEPNGDGGSIVFVRSASRVGRGDFGQNARNIEALQEAMDANLGVD